MNLISNISKFLDSQDRGSGEEPLERLGHHEKSPLGGHRESRCPPPFQQYEQNSRQEIFSIPRQT